MTAPSDTSRRSRGLRALKLWIPADYLAKLDALCDDSGYSRAEMVLGMIDAETDRTAELQSSKSPPAARARGAKR